jgi:hypothetical protein
LSLDICSVYIFWLKVMLLRNDVASNDVASQPVVCGMPVILTPARDVASNDVASQPVVRGMPVTLTPARVVNLRLGSFNVGIMQNQLISPKAMKKVMQHLDRIIHNCVTDGDLDMFSMCEVGGHLQGMPAAGISAGDLSVLACGAIQYSNMQNYLSCWNFKADASQPGLRKLRSPQVHRLSASIKCDPQLVVQVFGYGEQVKLVQGNLHIRTPNGATTTIATRKRVVVQALGILESAAKLEKERANDDASQPVVCVLLGDTNLLKSEGEEAVQPLQPVLDGKWDHS